MSTASTLSPPPLHGPASGFFPTSDGREVEIRDVWASNLEEEMSKIRELVEIYSFIAMVSLILNFVIKTLKILTLSFFPRLRTPNSLV